MAARNNASIIIISLFILAITSSLYLLYIYQPIILHLLLGTNYNNGEEILFKFVVINSILFATSLCTLISLFILHLINKKEKKVTVIKPKHKAKWIYGTIAGFVILIFLLLSGNKPNIEPTSSDQCNIDEALKKAKLCTLVVIRDDGGHGSGFSVMNGYLVTNKHVVEGARKLTTWINGEKELSFWNYSPTLDIAILKLPEDVPTCDWFESSSLRTAESLYALGWPQYPTGESTITKGIFSRLNQFDAGLEFIQTDAAINPGNSGGPLISSCGVVGINTLKESWSNEELPRPLEGLGNALSSRILKPLVSELISKGGTSKIPQDKIVYTKSNPQIPSQKPTLDISEIKTYVSNLYSWKKSWEINSSRYPKDQYNKLIDLFNRQIEFCTTLINRLQTNNYPSQDDLIMWDSVVKMSYESSAIAEWLRNY